MMARTTRSDEKTSRRWCLRSVLLAAGLMALSGGQATAAIIASPAPVMVNEDFTGKSVGISFQGIQDFVFSDNTTHVDPNDSTYPYVTVQTSGGGSVYAPSGAPEATAALSLIQLSIGPAQQLDFKPFSTAEGIPFSLGEFAVGLSDFYKGQNYYGYATFSGTTLVSYAFQTAANVPAVLPTVPLPASAPLFGAAILMLGAVAYGRRRTSPVEAP